jgi:hypothetical protein
MKERFGFISRLQRLMILLAFARDESGLAQEQPDDLRLVITLDGDLVSIDTQGQNQQVLVRNDCLNHAKSVLGDGHTLAFFARVTRILRSSSSRARI